MSAADLAALADSLSESADVLHRRIMRAIRRNQATGGQAIAHAEAQALFEQEVGLRQQANLLYAEAVRDTARGMAGPAHELAALAGRARELIARIDRAKELAGVAAALLGAAAAFTAQRPEAMVPALEALKQHLEALHRMSAAAAGASDDNKDKTGSIVPGRRHTMEP
jgi:hypothetical protein